jgi:integrase
MLLDELNRHRRQQTEIRLRKGSKWQDLDLVFSTGIGTPMCHCWYSDSLKGEIATRAGIRPVSLHTLRKTGASLLESLGVSRAETQVALRHKRPSVTDIYVSVYMEQRREHIEQLSDLLIDVPSISHSTLKVG